MFRTKKAQSIPEFAVLIALVAAALIAMQVYVKRGLQGRLKDLADQISTRQYESEDTTSNYTTERDAAIVDRQQRETFTRYQGAQPTGESLRYIGGPEVVNRTGWERTTGD